jgi:hypothetical protein
MEKTEGGKPPLFLSTMLVAKRLYISSLRKRKTTNKDSPITVYNAERSGAYIVNDLH